MKWEEVEFQAIYEIPSRNGIYKPAKYQGRGEKIVNMKELFAFDFIGDIDMRRVQLENKEKPIFLLQPGDLLFGRRSLVESGAGKCSIISEILEDTTFESSIIRVRIDRLKGSPLFYYYYFKSLEGRGRVLSLSSGTNVKGIRGSDLKSLQVISPPITIQRKIATILSAYDDLIENNRQRIRLLEEQARVEYERVIANELLEEVELAQIASVNAQTLRANNIPEQILYVDISSVSPGSIDEKKGYKRENAPGRARRLVQHIDIIWSCVRPNRRSYALIWNPEENLVVSTGFAVITLNTQIGLFIYQVLSSDQFVGHLENNATGSAYPAVTAGDFEQAAIEVPSMEVMLDYHQRLEPVYAMIDSLRQQNARLREARDLLLPRLMRGEIAV